MDTHFTLSNFDQSCQNLSRALQIPTVSSEDPGQWEEQPFLEFQSWLQSVYPKVHQLLEKENIGHALLLHWQGKNESEKPVLLCAHYDVVPAENEGWQYGPFSGAIEEGYIWGRGALDDKVSLIGIMEGVECLLEQDFRPERSVYLAFGYDEEIGGINGAAQIAETLEKRGIRFATVLDEGVAVTEGVVPGVKQPVALIGTAEKRSHNLRMWVEKEGGHASMPKQPTAIELLSGAIDNIRSHSLPVRFEAPVKEMFAHLAPAMKGLKSFALKRPELFKPLVVKAYEQTATGCAAIRSTITPTILKAGNKKNTIPGKAEANLNVRLLPGDQLADVVKALKNAVNDDRVQFDFDKSEKGPSTGTVSSIDTEDYQVLKEAIQTEFPEALVSPTLVLGTTDSRHYSSIADQIYRFSPIFLQKEDLARIHGINERIAVKDFERVIRFYGNFVRKVAEGSKPGD